MRIIVSIVFRAIFHVGGKVGLLFTMPRQKRKAKAENSEDEGTVPSKILKSVKENNSTRDLKLRIERW